MRRALAGLALLLLGAGTAATAAAQAATLPSGFRDDAFLPGLEEPTSFALAPGGQVLVAEKAGRIMVYDDLAGEQPEVFADLRKPVYDSGDRGLLAIALDPDFPAQPYVYALYTFDHVLGEDDPGEFPRWGEGPDYEGDPCPLPGGVDVDACPVSGRLVRLTAEPGSPGAFEAVESGGEPSEQVLLEDWCQQFGSHSVGDLEFAADGSLYVSGGEGANYNVPDYGQFGWPQPNQCGDPPGGLGAELVPPFAEGGALRSQDLLTPATPGDPTGLDGTVARIDPETGAGLPGNPLSASADANERRIVAFGYRNPWRLELDDQHGDLYVGHVGWGTYEEIDRVPALPATPLPGAALPNSGWPCMEGPRWNSGYENADLALCEQLYDERENTVLPFFFSRHGTGVIPGEDCASEYGSATAGMEVYRGGAFPPRYEGALFFADVVRGCVYVSLPGHDGRPDPEAIELFLAEGDDFPGIDLATGPEGSLFYLSLAAGTGGPSLHRVSYDPQSPIARIAAGPEWGPVSPDPLEIEFDASGSEDPAGAALEYEWDLDGDGSFETDTGTSPQASKAYTASVNVRVGVRVDNGTRESVARVRVYPGDTPPQPLIAAPSPSREWATGEAIWFEGHAEDAEEPGGEIGEPELRWKTRLLHCPDACHAHPLQTFPGTNDGWLSTVDHEYPARIELRLTATDARGLSATTVIELSPRTVDLELASDPAGIELGAGEGSRAAPFTLRAIEGSSVLLAAPETALLGGVEWHWRGWSDGGARVHTVVAEESRTYTAGYENLLVGPPPPPPAPVPPAARPSTRLGKKPAKRTRSRTARFAFGADRAGTGFRCKLDREPYRRCRSPRVYRHLRPGRHVLRVQAIAADGTVEAQPALYRWRILPPRR